MGISYLSKPIAPGVIPMQEPVELIAQATAQKQAKYDSMLTAVMGQYENLLNLDVSSWGQQQERYNQLMVQANRDMASLAKLDLLNPDNAQKIENIFTPILGDSDIMLAVAESQKTKKEMAIFQSLQAKGSPLYSAENYRFWQNQKMENYNMGDEFRTERNQDGVIFYRDINEKIAKQLKALPTVENVIQQSDGKWIVNLKGGGTQPLETMMDAIQLDADDIAQARVNAWSSAPSTDAKYYIENNIQNFIATKKAYEKVNTGEKVALDIWKTRLAEIPSRDANSPLTSAEVEIYKQKWSMPELTTSYTVGQLKAYVEKTIAEKEAAISSNQEKISNQEQNISRYQTTYGFTYDAATNQFSYTRDFKNRELDALRTQNYVAGLKESLSKAYFYKTQSMTMEYDPTYLRGLDFAYDAKLKVMDAEIEAAKVSSGISTTTTTTPAAPAITPLAGTTGQPTTYSREQFFQEKSAIETQRTAVFSDYVKNFTLAKTGDLTSDPQKYEQQAKDQLTLVTQALNEGLKDGFYTIAGTQVAEADFKTTYATQIQTVMALKNLEETKKLYEKIETSLKSSVVPMALTAPTRNLLVTKGYIHVGTGTLSQVSSTSPTTQAPTSSTPSLQLIKVNLPSTVLEDAKTNQNFHVVNPQTLVSIFNANKNNESFKTAFPDIATFTTAVKKGFHVGDPNFSNSTFLKPVDTSKEIDEQYSKLAEINVPKAFALTPGSKLRTIIEAQVIGQDVLAGQFGEAADLQVILEVDKTSPSGYKIKAAKQDSTEVRTYPLPQDIVNQFPKELQQLNGIVEIDNMMMLLRRSELAKTNPNYKLSGLPAEVVTVHYNGEVFQIEPESGGQTVKLFWKTAPRNPQTNEVDVPNQTITNIPYLGNNGVSNQIMNLVSGATSTGQVDLIGYYNTLNQILKNTLK